MPGQYSLTDIDQPAPVADGPAKTGKFKLSDIAPPQAPPADPRVGGQKVLDYTNDTLSNIPGSALKLAGNIGSAIAHPIDTAGNIAKVVAGTAQKMTPGYVTEDRPGYSKEADAAWGALKDRYGSPHAIVESIRTDPVGVASDISALAGGVSGMARGGAAVADAANFGRTAGAASKIADAAGVVSDATNPVKLAMKPLASAAKGAGRGFAKSALSLPGRTERYGATPAQAALEETSGLTPVAVKASAIARLGELRQQLQQLTAGAIRNPSLKPARDAVAADIAEVMKNNGLVDDLKPMQDQLTNPRPGFGGAIDPSTGEIAAEQDPSTFLGMKHQFGEDFTKFDAAAPTKSSARSVGNKAYHEMAEEFNSAVPGAREVNQKIQSLIPVKEGAQRAGEHVGVVQRSIDRATRPTGALAAVLLGLKEAGASGALLALATQEGLSSPTVKMAIARSLYGSGKAASNPVVSRALNALGVSGEMNANSPGFGGIPKFAKGGTIRRPTLLSDLKTGKPTGIMAEAGPEAIVPLGNPDEPTAAKSTVPERPDTMRLQLDQLTQGARRVVMFPHGTPMLKRPKGMQAYQDAHGNSFIFDPSAISTDQIDAAIEKDDLPSILGAADGGMGAPDKSALKPPVEAVVGRDADGVTTQATATDAAHEDEAVQQTKKVTPHGSVHVEPASREIKRRIKFPALRAPGPIR